MDQELEIAELEDEYGSESEEEVPPSEIDQSNNPAIVPDVPVE